MAQALLIFVILAGNLLRQFNQFRNCPNYF